MKGGVARKCGALPPLPALSPHFPEGKPISAAKKADLLHLSHFLPQQFHPFYQKFPADDDDNEDGAGNLDSCFELYMQGC